MILAAFSSEEPETSYVKISTHIVSSSVERTRGVEMKEKHLHLRHVAGPRTESQQDREWRIDERDFHQM
jgi:hypothetical protein